MKIFSQELMTDTLEQKLLHLMKLDHKLVFLKEQKVMMFFLSRQMLRKSRTNQAVLDQVLLMAMTIIPLRSLQSHQLVTVQPATLEPMVLKQSVVKIKILE